MRRERKDKMNADLILQHPCFGSGSRERGRIHLPVAGGCNLRCEFCQPEHNVCFHGCRPGLASNILTADQAIERLDWALQADPSLLVVGVAGPGEPLLSKASFAFFEKARKKYPGLLFCVSTNGLLLPERIEQLDGLVDALTVTVNALSVETAKKMYTSVMGRTDDKAYETFLSNQWKGIEMAVKIGLPVKVNTVFVDGRNHEEIVPIAEKAYAHGAYIHNVLPVIANHNVRENEIPSRERVRQMRKECEKYLPQLTCCQHCRADVFIHGCKKGGAEREKDKGCK
jgi:nitrogen fixation protein NifB